jgi:hypothetical protein
MRGVQEHEEALGTLLTCVALRPCVTRMTGAELLCPSRVPLCRGESNRADNSMTVCAGSLSRVHTSRHIALQTP